jgi:hypothetical protein
MLLDGDAVGNAETVEFGYMYVEFVELYHPTNIVGAAVCDDVVVSKVADDDDEPLAATSPSALVLDVEFDMRCETFFTVAATTMATITAAATQRRMAKLRRWRPKIRDGGESFSGSKPRPDWAVLYGCDGAEPWL